MLDELETRCDGDNCSRQLREENLMMVYRTADGQRRAYECDCGAVTITVSR